MKHSVFGCVLAISGSLMAAPVLAHDPAEHAKNAESPDCAAMGAMDHSKMDMSDPVTQALMKKCHGAQSKPADSESHREMNREGAGESTPATRENHEGHGSH